MEVLTTLSAISEGIPLPPDAVDGLLGSGTSGFEAWYNLKLSSWFDVTLDYQAVRSAFKPIDTSHVLGLRLKIDF